MVFSLSPGSAPCSSCCLLLAAAIPHEALCTQLERGSLAFGCAPCACAEVQRPTGQNTPFDLGPHSEITWSVVDRLWAIV